MTLLNWKKMTTENKISQNTQDYKRLATGFHTHTMISLIMPTLVSNLIGEEEFKNFGDIQVKTSEA